jgi:hypothetical protein
MERDFDSTITIGNLFAIASFVAAASVAIIKRDTRMKIFDIVATDKRFEATVETLNEQADVLGRIPVYTVHARAPSCA